MQNRILFLDTTHSFLLTALRNDGFNCDEDYTSNREVIDEKIGVYDGIVIRSRFKIDKQFIDAASNIKFIARVGAGMENIDVEYALSKNIQCLHAPEGNRTAVAEQCIATLLCLFNNILKADPEVRQNKWIREDNRGIELEGKTVAIIGYGNMGSAFAQRLQGFGVKVLCYDKYKQNYINNSVCRETTLQEIFDKADVVSFHIPYNSENQYLVDEKFINSFKKEIYIINASRGKILKTADLVKALETKKVLGACLDVLEYESISFENIGEDEPEAFTKLKQMPNVILTPHIAGWTHESNKKMAEVLVEKIMQLFH
jgi:D-3-phosphoglycerate dehydrogenase